MSEVMDRKCICYTADLFRYGRPLILRYRFFSGLQENSIPKPDNKFVDPNTDSQILFKAGAPPSASSAIRRSPSFDGCSTMLRKSSLLPELMQPHS